MNPKTSLTFSVMLLVTLLYGCTAGENATTGINSPFIGGQNAVLVNFIESAPPSEVFDGKSGTPRETFDVIVNLENVGEFSIPSGKIKANLKGIDPRDFTGGSRNGRTSVASSSELRGQSKDSEGNKIESPPVQLGFGTFGYGPNLVGNFQTNLRVDICYQYETRAVGIYCKLSDITEKNGICDIRGVKKIYNSGAPVQIVSMTQAPAGSNELLFTFKVRKLSNSGDVFKPGNQACTGTAEKNRVKVIVETEEGQNPKCQGLTNGDILFLGSSGEATFTCIQNIGTQRADAEKPVRITLQYDFLDSKASTLLIKHLGE
ncbi:hypothetical protein J4475_03210 [Candidatus Woesearchaeota archaeon]|nr:hypothetical protein [Candidatus Woesearchaeota archaeon]